MFSSRVRGDDLLRLEWLYGRRRRRRPALALVSRRGHNAEGPSAVLTEEEIHAQGDFRACGRACGPVLGTARQLVRPVRAGLAALRGDESARTGRGGDLRQVRLVRLAGGV